MVKLAGLLGISLLFRLRDALPALPISCVARLTSAAPARPRNPPHEVGACLAFPPSVQHLQIMHQHDRRLEFERIRVGGRNHEIRGLGHIKGRKAGAARLIDDKQIAQPPQRADPDDGAGPSPRSLAEC